MVEQASAPFFHSLADDRRQCFFRTVRTWIVANTEYKMANGSTMKQVQSNESTMMSPSLCVPSWRKPTVADTQTVTRECTISLAACFELLHIMKREANNYYHPPSGIKSVNVPP